MPKMFYETNTRVEVTGSDFHLSLKIEGKAIGRGIQCLTVTTTLAYYTTVPPNMRLGCKSSTGTNTIAYSFAAPPTNKKKFHVIVTRFCHRAADDPDVCSKLWNKSASLVRL
jgi:hypothetical protein